MEAAKGGSHCALPGHTVGPDHSRLGKRACDPGSITEDTLR